MTQDAELLKVLSTAHFPVDQAFLVKIDNELLNVIKIGASEWRVQRGMLDTKPVAHAKGAAVTQAPQYLQALYDYLLIARGSPFAKPVPDKVYKLDLKEIGKQTVVRGDTLNLTLPLEGVNPSLANPQITVKSDLPGLVSEADKLKWSPGKEQKPGNYPVTVTVNQEGQKVERTFQLDFLEQNTPPKIETVASVIAYQTQPLTLYVKATDPDQPTQKLRFGLAGGAPEGVRINPESGELTWTPSASTELKEYPITVTVSDSGTPPVTSSQQINVSVSLDDAFFTFLTGSIEIDGKKIAWIRNRATNQKQEVQEGDSLKVADIQGVVKTITDQHLILGLAG